MDLSFLQCTRDDRVASTNLLLSLFDNVHADEVTPCCQQALSHWSDMPVSHDQPIALCRRHNAVRSAREEHFVGCVEVVDLQASFLNRDIQFLSQLNHSLAADSIETVFCGRRF